MGVAAGISATVAAGGTKDAASGFNDEDDDGSPPGLTEDEVELAAVVPIDPIANIWFELVPKLRVELADPNTGAGVPDPNRVGELDVDENEGTNAFWVTASLDAATTGSLGATPKVRTLSVAAPPTIERKGS